MYEIKKNEKHCDMTMSISYNGCHYPYHCYYLLLFVKSVCKKTKMCYTNKFVLPMFISKYYIDPRGGNECTSSKTKRFRQ